jgi:hypothetical protein
MQAFRRLLTTCFAVGLVACQPAASTSTLSASPTPVAVDGDQLVAAFYKLVTADDFTAKTELTGLISGGALQLSIHATGDLSGGNGSMTLKLNTVSDTIEIEEIYVGEDAYVREGGGVWQRLSRWLVNTSGAQLDPFAFLSSADDLRYDGTATHDGQELYALVNTRGLGLAGGSAAAALNVFGEATPLQILVQSDGTPVFLSYHMTVFLHESSGEKVGAIGDIKQSFTGVGEPVTIQAPTDFIEQPTASPA